MLFWGPSALVLRCVQKTYHLLSDTFLNKRGSIYNESQSFVSWCQYSSDKLHGICAWGWGCCPMQFRKVSNQWTVNLFHIIITSVVQANIFFFFNCCYGWRYIVAFTKALTICQIYITWIHPLHCSLSPPSPNSWNSFDRYHFLFIFMCIHYLHHIHPPTPFPSSFSLPLVPTPTPYSMEPVSPSCSLIL
jgi:hypothetical protein